ncbi:MAG: hypothetical protein LBG97_08020 [Coriobacteriales bacterium]|jgi:hypothetical protein|nr:hypothetical protein [Coriobacteriales bacterium]
MSLATALLSFWLGQKFFNPDVRSYNSLLIKELPNLRDEINYQIQLMQAKAKPAKLILNEYRSQRADALRLTRGYRERFFRTLLSEVLCEGAKVPNSSIPLLSEYVIEDIANHVEKEYHAPSTTTLDDSVFGSETKLPLDTKMDGVDAILSLPNSDVNPDATSDVEAGADGLDDGSDTLGAPGVLQGGGEPLVSEATTLGSSIGRPDGTMVDVEIPGIGKITIPLDQLTGLMRKQPHTIVGRTYNITNHYPDLNGSAGIFGSSDALGNIGNLGNPFGSGNAQSNLGNSENVQYKITRITQTPNGQSQKASVLVQPENASFLNSDDAPEAVRELVKK